MVARLARPVTAEAWPEPDVGSSNASGELHERCRQAAGKLGRALLSVNVVNTTSRATTLRNQELC